MMGNVSITFRCTSTAVRRSSSSVTPARESRRSFARSWSSRSPISGRLVSDGVGAADIFVTPYLIELNEAQSTSGTLAYAVGCGKAANSEYRYARELLGEGRAGDCLYRDV